VPDSIVERVLATAHRLRWAGWFWGAVALACYLVDLGGQLQLNLTDGDGRAFGDDFVNLWSGARFALDGRAAQVFDFPTFRAFEDALLGGALVPYRYGYPPVHLMLTAPIALLPYVVGLAVWQVGAFAAFAAALRRLVDARTAVLLALVTPAMIVNLIPSQNGTLIAALLGGALCVLDRRPVLAGILIGLISIKPHMALLVPLAFVADGRWRAFWSAAATVIGLAALSILVFGLEPWIGFLTWLDIQRELILERGGWEVWFRMASTFVGMRLLGADIWLAYAVQLAVSAGAAAAVVAVWRSPAPQALKNAVLVVGTLAATPYLQDYDMVVTTFVVVWLFQEARAHPDLAPSRWTVASVLALWLYPVLTAALGYNFSLSLGGPVMVWALAMLTRLTLQAARAPQPAAAPAPAGE